MANILTKDYPTLVDVLKTQNDSADVIEMCAEVNPMIKDAVYQQCNDGSTHDVVVVNGLAEAQFRAYYEGVKPSTGRTTQVKLTTGMLESRGLADKKLVDKHKNPAKFRLVLNKTHIEAMNNTMQKEIIYGVKTKGGKFNGLATCYNSISNDKNKVGYNVVNAHGTGDNLTSIYMVSWGDTGTSFIYPDAENDNGGLKHTAKPADTVRNEDGTEYEAYRDIYEWDLGLCVANWKSGGRIANIDVSKFGTDDAPDLEDLMTTLYYKTMGKRTGMNTVFYVPIEVIIEFERQVKAKYKNPADVIKYLDEDIVAFKKIPLRLCEQISTNEAKVA